MQFIEINLRERYNAYRKTNARHLRKKLKNTKYHLKKSNKKKGRESDEKFRQVQRSYPSILCML